MNRITAQIGIDMAHRVPDHGSKCRNLHGHRYLIIATAEGDLASRGEEKGMVMDFGFLKELMMSEIDERCDHGLCLYVHDPAAAHILGAQYRGACSIVEADGDASILNPPDANPFGAGKILLMCEVPTAENLAALWFYWLAEPVKVRSGGRARLVSIKIWETPNFSAEYFA